MFQPRLCFFVFPIFFELEGMGMIYITRCSVGVSLVNAWVAGIPNGRLLRLALYSHHGSCINL